VIIILAYGRNGLKIDLRADRTDMIEPTDTPGLADEASHCPDRPIGTLPLRQLTSSGTRVVIR
jgi:hypothetical protein